MKKILNGSILPLVLLSTLAATAGAQEFFREFGTSRTYSGSARATSSYGGIGYLGSSQEVFAGNDPSGLPGVEPVDDLADNENYNIRIGNLDLIFALGLGVEYNDNITLANHDRISDLIFRPELDIEGVYAFSDTNKIRFGVGLAYEKYFDHSEFDTDGLLISPNSAISWSAKTGNLTFTLRERLSYTEDPFEQPTLSNVTRYRRWENQAGFEVNWEASEYTHLVVGYDRYDLWSKDELYKSQDHSVDTIFARPSYQLSPNFAVGLSASYSWVNYKENQQADANVMLVGPYVEWRINDLTSLYVEVGYQRANFDGDSHLELLDPTTGKGTGRFITDTEDSDNVYAKIDLVNTPSENFRQKLSASRTTELGLGSNFYDLYHFEYTVDWKVAENTSIRPSIFYEYYETSGDVAEKAHRFGGALGIYHIFSDHLTLGLDYRYIRKDSNVADADYYQNLALLTLFYKF